MATPVVDNKYTLRSLHQEIDLFDRKLAHMAQYDLSPAGPVRERAERKLSLRREQLATTARRMAADGVSFDVSELPRSFRDKDAPAAVDSTPADTAQPVTAVVPKKAQKHPSAFAGTSLDADKALLEYMRDRKTALS